MRTATAVTASLLLLASGARAQEAEDVLDGLRNGGGWVSVDLEDGVGSVRTARVPTLGMTVAGCLNVWGGHSGTFEIHARDLISDTSLVVRAEPGSGVPFRHTFGAQAQLEVEFRWTEPRDTTLLMWIGLAVGRTVEEACEPVFGR